MQDFALNRVAALFATLPGVSAPPPFGGNQRTIVVRLVTGSHAPIWHLARGSDCGGEPFKLRLQPSGNVRTGDLALDSIH